MSAKLDLRGMRFGRLRAIRPDYGPGRSRWICVCDCGAVVSIATCHLREGSTRSCGCLSREATGKRNTTHGGRRDPEYRVWVGIKKRCLDPGYEHFADYGGRGITVCERWRDSYAAFLADVGRRPSEKHSIDRVDANGNYEPGNVRWATRSEQMRNTRRSIFATIDGETLPLKDWCLRLGLNYKVVHGRIRRGSTPERALRGKR